MSEPVRPSVAELLFHEPPFVLLDRYVDDLGDGVVCEVDIRPGIPFHGKDGVPAFVALEYMAQAIGVYAGLGNKMAGRGPEIGFLLGSRQVLLACERFATGCTLRVTAERIWDGGKVVQFRCAVMDKDSGVQLATANLSAYSPNRTEGERDE